MGVIAAEGGAAGLVEQLRQANVAGDVELLGGPRTIRTFLDIGAIDRLGIVVLPVLLGTGIPLFAIAPTAFSNAAWQASLAAPSSGVAARPMPRLESHRTYPDGAIELVYRQEA
ncbi:MAG: dihydrofolate reductase family protein [Thermomicrobiales bacterium]